MKTQMTQIGIGFAALVALAAEGKDFNRTEFPTCLGGCREARACSAALQPLPIRSLSENEKGVAIHSFSITERYDFVVDGD